MCPRAPARPPGLGVTRRTPAPEGLLRTAQQEPADRRHRDKSQRGYGGSADRRTEHDEHHRHEQTAERGPANHIARRVGGGGGHGRGRGRGVRPRGGGVVVRSYGHVGSLVTGGGRGDRGERADHGGPMINEASGRPVTYHPPGGPPPHGPVCVLVRVPVHVPVYGPSGVAIPDGLGHAPWNAACATAAPGQKRSVAVPLGVRGWEDDSQTQLRCPVNCCSFTQGPSSPRHRWPVTKSPNPLTASS